MTTSNNVSCVIMAGGKSSRMGTDKSWVDVSGKPMITRVIDIITPQVNEIIINTNSDDKKYYDLGYPVQNDIIKGFKGPLSGVLVGLKNCNNDIVLSVPVDCPLLPNDLVSRMLSSITDEVDVVVARREGQNHPVIALWKKRLVSQLEKNINNGIYKVDLFTKNLCCVQTDFDNYDYDIFMNINTQEDINKVKNHING